MKINALSPWYGAKRTLAATIVDELGPHSAYWEPFCGSMAVLLSKPAATMETVNDLHGDLINLAKAIQDPTEGSRLYRRLRRTLFASDLFDASAAAIKYCPFQPGLQRAYDYFICSWMGRAGVQGSKSDSHTYSIRYTANGGHSGKRFTSAVDSIPAWRKRLREVTILNKDGFGLLEKIQDAAKTVIYCDPPYLAKGAKYIHDFGPQDHERLAKLLRRFKKARVVVSYYSNPLLETLYPKDRWTHREVFRTKSLVNQGMRDSRGSAAIAPEVLLINGNGYGKNRKLF